VLGIIAEGVAQTRAERDAAIERAWRPKPHTVSVTIALDTSRFREALTRLDAELAAFAAAANETAAAMRILGDTANKADTRISRRSPEEVPDVRGDRA